jgi:hypothetical protein
LSRTESRLTKASILSYNRESRPLGIRDAIGRADSGPGGLALTLSV